MHYIIGTVFNVEGIVRGTSSPDVLMANRGSRMFTETGHHELYYIKPRRTSEGEMVITYTFRNLDTNILQDIDFKNTKEADTLLASLLKEQLPDYTKAYEDMSD